MSDNCQNSKCNKELVNSKGGRDKKFCSQDCYKQHKKDNPRSYSKGRFKKGEASWNKGRRFTEMGSFMIRKTTLKSGNEKKLRFVSVGYNDNGSIKYVRNDKYVWENSNGPMEKGYVVYHKDGRTLNDELSNLDSITLGEAISRYSALREQVYDLKSKKDIKRIIKGCLVNDRRIQKMIFEMTYGRMMGIIMRYSQDQDSAQDILSDTWIKIFKKIDTFDNSGSFEGWITRIAINTALDSIRKKSNTTVMDINDMSYFDGMSVEDEEFELEEIKGLSSDALLKEIQNLSPSYRAVFNLFVFEEMSHKDIGVKLGISEGTSKSNLSKARGVLRKRVTKLIAKNKSEQERIIEDYRIYDRENAKV
jgi:RNA polymerase sigma factor (sigma-70 family)